MSRGCAPAAQQSSPACTAPLLQARLARPRPHCLPLTAARVRAKVSRSEQGDGFNCGIFLILIMWCLAYGAPLDATIRVREMDAWRVRVALWMMQGSLSLEQ